eukprot:CAMPEP_0198204008 /NCGR_PEP_ID=MMETSP1445-20131203/7357_1 /TAXON_ID=36898 /ORGANISM="Pyramimonas sp., Strain CCMP2087" /LENGTH=409 /DNA_ID=CAMNT_0043875663 /DNA_START=55 /DNA_END=1281 /DNA_ORIENTATION=-
MTIDKADNADDRVEYLPPNRTSAARPTPAARPQSAMSQLATCSKDDFRQKFEQEWMATLQQVEKPYEVGQIVEALGSGTSKDAYSLYYTAEITAISENPGGSSTFTLKYEDGSIDDAMHPLFVRPNTRTTVYEDDLLKVIDGHVAVKGIAYPARLLSFQSCPQLYQSAVMLVDNIPVHDCFPFEQHQALSLPLALQQDLMEDGPIRAALIGMGGGNVPMTIRHVAQDSVIMDVVELSREVIAAAVEHFGVVEDSHLRIHEQDGVAFLEAAEENAFDLILIDAADFESKDCEDDPDALEVPPPTFVDPAFLVGPLSRALAPDGLCCYNIIAGRRKLVELARLFQRTFASVYVMATDPNYFFVGCVRLREASAEQMVALVKGWKPLCAVVPDVIKHLEKTSENLDNTLLGW